VSPFSFFNTVCVLSPTFIEAVWIRAASVGERALPLGALLPE
jgi:hypothetical protein